MTVHDNPCQACPDNCCSIKGLCGLILSKDEFETLFIDHEQDLQVREEDKIVVISSKEGLMCPHFENGGCQIYDERPFDCRLYPYQMRLAYETGKTIKLILHSRSDCPRKKTLLVPEFEAITLVTNFGKKVYGEKKILVQNCDNLVTRLWNKCEVLLVKFCKKLKIL